MNELKKKKKEWKFKYNIFGLIIKVYKILSSILIYNYIVVNVYFTEINHKETKSSNFTSNNDYLF